MNNFPFISYVVCSYCKHVAPYNLKGDITALACGRNMERGLVEIIASDKEGKINGVRGCSDFTPSGLHAHPEVLEKLRENNPKTERIPVNNNRVSSSWEFYREMLNYRERT